MILPLARRVEWQGEGGTRGVSLVSSHPSSLPLDRAMQTVLQSSATKPAADPEKCPLGLLDLPPEVRLILSREPTIEIIFHTPPLELTSPLSLTRPGHASHREFPHLPNVTSSTQHACPSVEIAWKHVLRPPLALERLPGALPAVLVRVHSASWPSIHSLDDEGILDLPALPTWGFGATKR